jgi:hypothetical protein
MSEQATDGGGEQPPSGYMVSLPVVAPEGMTITAIQTAMLPWQAPRALATLGHTTEGNDPALSIAMEWPIIWLRTLQPLPKFDHETLLSRTGSGGELG